MNESNEQRLRREQSALFLDHLERRRASVDQGLWQGPTLTIAAQAFLLIVLTDHTVERSARLAVLIAGLAAIVAALLSLVRGRKREVYYSERIAQYFKDFGMPDPRPVATEPVVGFLTRPLTYWGLALILFAIADFVAFK